MLRKALFISTLIAMTAVYADTSPATATTTPTPPPEPVAGATQPTNIPGAYANVNVNDQGVKDAANFAVSQLSQGDLVKIVSAQVQVVEGKNYNLSLILAQNGVNSRFDVTVFVPLPNSGDDTQLTNVEAYGETDNNGNPIN